MTETTISMPNLGPERTPGGVAYYTDAHVANWPILYSPPRS